jgi:hypothetical protein
MRANALTVAAAMLIVGCASYTPRLDPEADFIQRAVVQEKGQLRVSVAVPTREEAARYLGVDDARFYLIQDLINSGALARFGYVKGVGISRRDEPRHNFTGDPYYTDGLRAVFFLSPHYIEYDEIDWVKEWERPPDPAELGRRSAGE